MRYWIADNNKLVEVKYSSLLHPVRAWRDFREFSAVNLVTSKTVLLEEYLKKKKLNKD